MRILSLLLLLLLSASPLWAQETEVDQPAETEATKVEEGKDEESCCYTGQPRPDSHAPIGVMGDHMHKKGEWMASYRYRAMDMDGNLNGTSSVSNQTVLKAYPVAPTGMNMSGHMFGLMYAPSDDVTMMLMLPVVDKSMDHINRKGATFRNAISAGLGDVRVGALVKLWENDKHHLHFNAGISLPTGSTSVRTTTPKGPNELLAYPMQRGSGTVDLMPGMTYTGFSENWSWGAQAMATIRMGKNDHGYAQSNVGELSVWGARKWNDHLSSSLRLYGSAWGDISGRDRRLPSANFGAPPMDPSLYAGSRLDVLLGLNARLGKGHRIGIEGGVPIAQSLDGYRVKTTWTMTAGYQYSF